MTGDEAIEKARTFAQDTLGKVCIDSQDRAGFVVNALLIPYLLSAIRMYESGFASKEDIDEGMVKGCAHPMGPLALSDLIGLDTLLAVSRVALRRVPRSRVRRAGAAQPDGRGGPARAQERARLLRLLEVSGPRYTWRPWNSGSPPSSTRTRPRARRARGSGCASSSSRRSSPSRSGSTSSRSGSITGPDFAVSVPGGRAGGAGGADVAGAALERRDGAVVRRSRARLPGLRDARPAVGRARRDHGGPRVVHRVVPAVRAGPRGLRRAVRLQARAAAGGAVERSA